MKKNRNGFFALIAVVALTTLFIRIPLPSRGYFNFGDVAVIFSGLVLGDRIRSKNGIGLGALCGGLGSATADILSGFVIFAPITFLAKGLEGGLSALASQKGTFFHVLFLILGGMSMIGIYFIGEYILPIMGPQAATAELIPNTIQACGGVIGGRLAFMTYKRITDDNDK